MVPLVTTVWRRNDIMIAYLLMLMIVMPPQCQYFVHAIQCYQCNSYENPECSALTVNSTDSPFYRECQVDDIGGQELEENTELFCRKTTQKVLANGGHNRVIRSCGWMVHRERIDNCRLADNDFKLENSCQCFSDGCNGTGGRFSYYMATQYIVAAITLATWTCLRSFYAVLL